MKFDVVLGNPPYQEEVEGTSAKQIYPMFMDMAYDIGERSILVTPGRFLFNAGKTPKKWNKKMLSDPHLKVIEYIGDGDSVFANTSITGGIAITYHDKNHRFGEIGTFIPYVHLKNIVNKVISYNNFEGIDSIIYNQSRFNLDVLYENYPELINVVGSNGRERRLTSNSFVLMPVFKKTLNTNQENIDYIRVLGLENSRRTYKYINRDYLNDELWLDKYKVFVPGSNGASGTLVNKPARMISKPVIGEPNDGMTQTFIGFGCFETKLEAEACYKYILSKFTRVLLGVLKVTQSNKPDTWKYVPLQDFTENSDIDWSKPIPEIDQQLYKKYNLNEEEIEFIETHVKEME